MIEIIPAIDLIEGKCVRLSQGKFTNVTVYGEDPVAMAQSFEQNGIKRLHMVDLDGARSGKVEQAHILKSITDTTSLVVDYGGGIRSEKDLQIVLENGAAQVVVGSLAVQQPGVVKGWLAEFGPEAIILGADVQQETIAVNGWEESSDLHISEFLESFLAAGLQYVLSTDVSRDGMMTGPAISLYKKIQQTFPALRLIASGGVRNIDDIQELDAAGFYGVVVGKAIYEGKISLESITQYHSIC